MSQAHTPGPWEVRYFQYDGTIGPSQFTRVYRSGTESEWIADCGYPDNPNANLISSAPDLLEACVAAKNLLDMGDVVGMTVSSQRVYDRLKSVIEKATEKVVNQ